MPLTCSVCQIDKWKSDFSRRDRDRGHRVCKACRDTRDKNKKLARLQASNEGKRICSVCHEAKPRGSFGKGKESRCRECKALQLRLLRENMLGHTGNGEHGNLEEGFLCTECKVRKPSTDFSISKTGYLDYRCKECSAKRSAAYRMTDQGRFTGAKAIATARAINWRLTLEEYTALRLLPCHYCGHPLPPSGIGLDRRDGDGCYETANVVACCFECNMAKASMFTYEEMLVIGQSIRIVKDVRLERGESFNRLNGWGRPRKYV